MAPKLKMPKATEMAAATVASVDNFIAIMRLAGRLQEKFSPAAAEVKARHVEHQ